MVSQEKQKSSRTILWWIVWITATIVAFFIAAAIWSPIIAEHFGSVRDAKTAAIWVTAVFGTWMIILVPLIVVMYQKVDRAYEDARINREKKEQMFRSINVPLEDRKLPTAIAEKIAQWEPTLEGGHLVHFTLKDGRKIEHAFIINNEELVGLYDAREMNFKVAEITSVTLETFENPTHFLTNRWLRLDGVSAA